MIKIIDDAESVGTATAASELRITSRSVCGLIGRHKLQAVKDGAGWRILRSELARYARERKPPGYHGQQRAQAQNTPSMAAE